jgi:type IV secretory pathway VirB6-like protein
VPQSRNLVSQQAVSACKGISSGRVSSLANVDLTVPLTPSFGLSTPAGSHFANSKTTRESQSELEHQLQALLSPSRDVLSSIEQDRHSSAQIDTSTHQIVSVEPFDEHRSSDMTFLSVSTNGLRLIVRSCV